MAITSGILGPGVNFEDRLVPSLEAMAERVANLRGLGQRIVLTSGAVGLIPRGPVKCLAKVKELGDVLVVGVDSDSKIRQRKGEDRPLVPERERLEMLGPPRPRAPLYPKGGG